MRIRVITSCTGEKSVSSPDRLTLDDFHQGPAQVRSRETSLGDLLTPAEDLYTGLQQQRLMRGVRAARKVPGIEVDLRILSAGYGLVSADQKLAPYQATFIGMARKEADAWAQVLGIPAAIRAALAEPCDLCLVLLGNDYLRACALDEQIQVGGPTLFLCGKDAALRLPRIPNLHPVVLSNAEATTFSCGLVGLKGEVAARVLQNLANNPELLGAYLETPQATVGSPISPASNAKTPNKPGARMTARANANVDRVIELPDSWWGKPHRQKLSYFIPEWDDLVDPDYDFENDIHSGGRGDWANEAYAHQMYEEPNYDGILVSRAVAEKSKKKNARINEMGVHRFLRVPRDFPIMGDCGAFDYIEQDEPPYTTDDVIDYYTRLDFDFGVSVDHLVVPAFETQKHRRYELTIHNAEEFVEEHRKLGLKWEPIGAVQGWDIKRYVEAARKYVAMGYRYIALGGLVRSQTQEILATVQAVREVVPADTKIHVFGFSRFDAVQDLIQAGANSIDSASMLRKAWLGANLNYLTPSGWYSAIRVPQAGGSFRAKRVVQEGKASLQQLERLEQDCLRELRKFAKSKQSPSSGLIEHLVEYDTLVAGERPGTEKRLLRTLEDRPWEKCGCEICRKWGIEVIIFRGNNRNRRRGFHNTYVFYRLMQEIANGTRTGIELDDQLQMELPFRRSTSA